MAKHYYQFPLDSEQGKRLVKFHRACIDAETKAEKYAKRMGAVSYYEDPNFFAGGVSCLAFKEPKKVNTDVWRMAYKDDGNTLWFEPNVRTSIGCVKARDGFTPSDVAGRIYKKEPVGWDAVRQFYSLKEWMAFCGFVSSGDKETDTNIVIGLLKDKRFYTYIDIIPMVAPVIGRKRSRDGSRAVQAEQMRMKLPTVHVDDFYRIVGADMTAGTENPKDPCAPVFFAYQESWFVGLDFPINQEGFIVITPQLFIAKKNQMLREQRDMA